MSDPLRSFSPEEWQKLRDGNHVKYIISMRDKASGRGGHGGQGGRGRGRGGRGKRNVSSTTQMTQTNEKVTKDLRMDLLLDAEVTRTIKRADWYAFGQLCYTYPLFCGNLFVQRSPWLVGMEDG